MVFVNCFEFVVLFFEVVLCFFDVDVEVCVCVLGGDFVVYVSLRLIRRSTVWGSGPPREKTQKQHTKHRTNTKKLKHNTKNKKRTNSDKIQQNTDFLDPHPVDP